MFEYKYIFNVYKYLPNITPNNNLPRSKAVTELISVIPTATIVRRSAKMKMNLLGDFYSQLHKNAPIIAPKGTIAVMYFS